MTDKKKTYNELLELAKYSQRKLMYEYIQQLCEACKNEYPHLSRRDIQYFVALGLDEHSGMPNASYSYADLIAEAVKKYPIHVWTEEQKKKLSHKQKSIWEMRKWKKDVIQKYGEDYFNNHLGKVWDPKEKRFVPNIVDRK